MRRNVMNTMGLSGLLLGCVFFTGCNTLATLSGLRLNSVVASKRTSREPKTAPPPVTTPFELARDLEKDGKLEPALSIYQELTEDTDCTSRTWHRLAIVHERLGNPDQAVACYEKALDTDAPDPQLLCDFGYSCYLQGNLEEAEEALQLALESGHEALPRAHNNLGLVYARQGRPGEAKTEFLLAGCSLSEARANLALATEVDAQP